MAPSAQSLINKDYIDLYNRFINAQMKIFLEISSKGGKSGRWPMPALEETSDVTVPVSPFIAQKLWEGLKQIKDRPNYLQIVKAAYKYPSILGRSAFLFRERTLWNIPEEEWLQFGETIAYGLAGMYKTDLFCENGTNIIYDEDEVNRFREHENKIDILNNDFKQLSGNLWMLAECLNPRWHNTFHEYSGPYQIDGQQIILKEFHNLHPDYVPANLLHYDLDYLMIVETYSQQATFSFDLHNRFNSGPHNDKHLISSYAIGNDTLTVQKLEDDVNKIRKSIAELGQYLRKMDRNQMIKANGDMEYFSLIRPLESVANITIMPTKYYENIQAAELTPEQKEVKKLFAETKKNDVASLKRLFDLKEPFFP